MLVKKAITTLALSTVFGMGMLVTTTAPASAHIVCNKWGDCWYTHTRYTYPSEVGVTFYDDPWYFRQRWEPSGKYRWRGEYHESHGYYRDGVWIELGVGTHD